MYKRNIRSWLVLTSLMFVCVAVIDKTTDAQDTDDIRPGETWVDLCLGEPVPFEAVVADLVTSRVVFLGERHRIERHHRLQREIVEAIAEQDVPLVVGIEQMEANYQPVLDRYAEGKIDFETLMKETDRETYWSSFEQYRQLLEAARDADAKLLALNAPPGVIRAVARSGGVDKLSPELRKQLPAEIPTEDPLYEQLLMMIMPVHAAASPERLRPMIEAQMSRDEMMASRLADYLKSEEGRDRTAVVVCGSGHVNYGLGTAGRLARRMPDASQRIILFSESGDLKLTEAERAASRPISITHEKLRKLRVPIADYLHITPRADEKSEE